MLTEPQAIAVAKFLMGSVPGDEHELGHGQMEAFQMACQILVALGCATQTPRGAKLLPSPRLPAPLPRWDDTCCVVLAAAVHSGKVKLQSPRSKPGDLTGPKTATPEAGALLGLLLALRKTGAGRKLRMLSSGVSRGRRCHHPTRPSSLRKWSRPSQPCQGMLMSSSARSLKGTKGL